MTGVLKNPGELRGKLIASMFFALLNLALFISVIFSLFFFNNLIISLELAKQEYKIVKDVFSLAHL